jgi:hypothetical protein
VEKMHSTSEVSKERNQPTLATAKAVNDMYHMNRAVQVAGQHYSSVVRHATHTGLRSVIKSLLEARRANDLDDDSFSELLEIILASYMENEVTAKVEALLNTKLMNVYAFGVGLKR